MEHNRLSDIRTLATDPNPPREGPEIFILRLKGNQTLSFAILSKSLWGIWVHWNGKKSEPHYKEDHLCIGCQAKRPKRWKGFLHCFCFEMGQEVFLELTPHSGHSLLAQLNKGGPLRGNRIQVRRTKGDNGRLLISVLTAIDNPAMLPNEKDPQESIMALWGLDPSGAQSGRELPTNNPALNGFH